MDRLQELQAIGWANMNGEQRKEYKALKDNPKPIEPVSEPTPEPKKKLSFASTLPDNTPKPVELPPNPIMQSICSQLWYSIKDGGDRAMILSYQTDQRRPVECLREMVLRLKDGTDKAVVYGFITQYENQP